MNINNEKLLRGRDRTIKDNKYEPGLPWDQKIVILGKRLIKIKKFYQGNISGKWQSQNLVPCL